MNCCPKCFPIQNRIKSIRWYHGRGQVFGELTFNPDDPSLNPAVVYNFTAERSALNIKEALNSTLKSCLNIFVTHLLMTGYEPGPSCIRIDRSDNGTPMKLYIDVKPVL